MKSFNAAQYGLLIECSQKEDFSKWNDCVSKTKDVIDLRDANLEGVDIIGAIFKNANGKGANFCDANLKGAKLEGVDMSDCAFLNADMTGIQAVGSVFLSSLFDRAKISNSFFALCHFNDASFQESNLVSTRFFDSNFYECKFYAADLSDAQFQGGGRNPLLKGEVRFDLCGASFVNSKFTSKTYFHLASVSRETDFRTVSFETACYSAGLRQTLQYCNRRHNWIAWYKKIGKAKSLLAKLFWMASDYGRSPRQLAISFLIVCFSYSFLYWLMPGSTSENINGGLSIIQSLYFSVVTMTTLGYGDISANKSSWLSQALVISHVLFGYLILGGLLTVLSNLFTSDGPPEGLIKHPVKARKSMTFHMPRTEQAPDSNEPSPS